MVDCSCFSFLLSATEVIDFFCSLFGRVDGLEKMEDMALDLKLEKQLLKATKKDLAREVTEKGKNMKHSSAINQWISAADNKIKEVESLLVLWEIEKERFCCCGICSPGCCCSTRRFGKDIAKRLKEVKYLMEISGFDRSLRTTSVMMRNEVQLSAMKASLKTTDSVSSADHEDIQQFQPASPTASSDDHARFGPEFFQHGEAVRKRKERKRN